MVEYQPSDVLTLQEFELAWRITGARWSSQPDSILRRIKPLAPARSKRLFESSPLRGPVKIPPEFGRLHTTQHRSLRESGSPDENDRINK
jgi:hypothetical protein